MASMKKTARQLNHDIAQVLARKRPSGRTRTHRAHATKGSSETSDRLNIDQLAEMFDLPTWERIDELNQEHYWDEARGVEGEDEQTKAEQAAQDAVYNQWYDAVEGTASKIFDEHGLELSPAGKEGTTKRRYNFKLVPAKSWNDVADKIRETVNGVGSFHYNNLREFLESGPYTARQAALSHLHWIKRYSDVYGGMSPKRMYDNLWR